MKTRFVAVATVVALTIVVVAAAAPDFASLQIQPYEPPKPAPAFSLPDLSGKKVDSKSLAGKVAVLSFGATWCSSCTSELKSLENLQAKFPSDLVVYFVAMDGRGEKDVKPYLEKHGHKIRTLIDPKMAVAREYGVRWLPVTVVRDRKGVIVGRAIGAREWDGKEALEFIQPLVKR